MIIAGIGFAGSYAAVRELAIQKGFGNFSYVFPIGIDAGICVLLALDLLLTWIRIPFPLLRQTAWLLTAATIAFNGAAAWPDPLGVSMHAVIPILFVVSVEAARHAIGRIADITADKHMEGVRLTRWLLSPIPTFLLWRRMKLWELRSYEQAIKLEQDRLVYQARLHSRFGRAWRRKAPVKSLMPLRLARYGVPLAETAPAGLAAAGIEPQPHPSAPRRTLDDTDTATTLADQPRNPARRTTHEPAASAHPHRIPGTGHTAQRSGRATTPHAQAAPVPTHPDATRDTAHPRPGTTTHHHTLGPVPATHPTPPPPTPPHASKRPHITTADRYYQAWDTFQHQHGREPNSTELSLYLTQHGIHGPHGQPIKPKALARYLLQFRIYHIWAQHRTLTNNPPTDQVAKDLAQHGITAQYNKPLHPNDLTPYLNRFEHRWQTLNTHPTNLDPQSS
ncbi:DUF2637 domain-containing protein [Streptomyces canus]|uniref:DUF2637 domain-containing protein n=1 Tax=Streptomyces canus TaxID=58343 RepID=UPI0021F10305|nr:DUF2637 domain-containing protein [Streptomyces canus]